MSSRLYLFVSVILTLSLFMAGCGGGADDQTPTVAPTTTPVLSAPTEPSVEQPESPLPDVGAPESPLNAPQPESPLGLAPAEANLSGCAQDFPTPTDGTGVVCGGVISASPTTKYLLAGDFYLAPVIYTKAKLEDGKEIDVPFVSLNVGTDKIADIKTETGGFVFLNVPPGEYSVVIYTPIQSFLFHDGTGQNTLMFTVEAGEVEQLAQLPLE